MHSQAFYAQLVQEMVESFGTSVPETDLLETPYSVQKMAKE